MAIESLKPAMTVSRISRAMDVPRSSIYYRKTERSGKRKPRVSTLTRNLFREQLRFHVKNSCKFSHLLRYLCHNDPVTDISEIYL